MAEDLIDKYVDRNALKQDTAFILNELNEVFAALKKVRESKVDLTNASTLNQTATAAKEASKNIDNLSTSYTKLTTVTTQATKETEKQTTTLESNIQARIRLQNSLQREAAIQREDLALLKAGIITKQEYNTRLTQSAILEEKYKNQIAVLNKEIKNQIAGTTQQIGAYALLNKEYLLAQTNAKNLSVIYGVQSKEAKTAAATALTLGNELKVIDASVGQNQRNVGNYAGSLGGYFNKLLGPLRTLANIIPGLGLSGIFLAAFEGLRYLTSEMGLFNIKLSDAQKNTKLLAEVNEKAAENAGKEVASLKILRAEIENTNVPMKTRLQAVKDIQEQYPKYFEGLTNEQILTGNVAGAYDLAAASILRKARANAAAAEIEKLSSKQLASEFETQKDVAETNNKIRLAKAKVITNAAIGPVGTEGLTKQEVQKGILEEFKIREEGRFNERQVAQKQIDFLLNLTTAGADETVKVTKEKTEASAKSLKKLSDELNTIFERSKNDQLENIRLLEDGVNNEKSSYDERIALLQDFSNAKINLNNDERDEEKRRIDATLANDILNLNKEKKKGADIEGINKEIEIKKNNANQQKLLIDSNYYVKSLQIFRDNEKKFAEVVKSSQDKELADIVLRKEQRKADIETEYTDAVKALEKKGLSEAEYKTKREKLDDFFRNKSLRAEIEYTRQIIELMGLRGVDVSKELQVLAKLERDLSTGTKGIVVKNEQTKQEKQLETIKKIEDAYNKIASVISSAIDASTTAQKNKIQDEIDGIENRKQKEIEAVNASTDSQADKANKIAIIEARAAAQKEQQERKQRILDQQKARFDKALSIGRITLSTAEAVMSALAMKPPNIPLAIFNGALGAAQLAIAIATPIPRFKDGLNEDYEGPAVVGDGGKSEAIVRRDGKIEITPATDTLTHINRGDRILPDASVLMQSMQYGAMAKVSQPTQQDYTKEMTAILTKELQGVKSAINSKRELHIKPGFNSVMAMHKYGEWFTNYVNEQTNF
mgnify:CR=1 FL=1